MLPIRLRGFYFVLVSVLFFLSSSSVSAHWFQTVSGDVYSNGQISISASQTGTPSNYFISTNDANRGTSGVITHNDGSPIIGSGTEDNGGAGIHSWIVRPLNSRPLDNGDTADSFDSYIQSLTRKLTMVNPINDANARRRRDSFCPDNLPGGANKDYSYYISGNVIIDNCSGPGFNPHGTGGPPNRSVIIVVEGDVLVRDPLVFADTRGGFFMLVAGGTMTFADSLGGSAASPALRGVFVAPTIRTSDNSLLNQANNAPALWGEGIFYALDTFQLNRHTANQSVPAETFIYKPSLMVSAPHSLWDTFSEYQEIEP